MLFNIFGKFSSYHNASLQQLFIVHYYLTTPFLHILTHAQSYALQLL